jgi:5-formyltetrahydrofolate cyclo-ligase
MPAAAEKQKLRAEALARRDAIGVGQRVAASQALAARALPFVVVPDAIVAGYAPIRSELDPSPLMHTLATLGAQLALPLIIGRDQPLQFRAWKPGAELLHGPLSILEPRLDAPDISPDIVLVPLAAFDRRGHRLGYGAGYYDRTLTQLRRLKHVVAIGVGFAMQEIAAVPAQPHDVALDYVLTEADSFDCRG